MVTTLADTFERGLGIGDISNAGGGTEAMTDDICIRCFSEISFYFFHSNLTYFSLIDLMRFFIF